MAEVVTPYIVRRCEAVACGAEPNSARVELTLGELRQLLVLTRQAGLARALGEALVDAWGENDRLRQVIGLAARRIRHGRGRAVETLRAEHERRLAAERRLRRARAVIDQLNRIVAGPEAIP